MIFRHLRTNIVGYLALFFALSAGAYAAALAPNSVRSGDRGPVRREGLPASRRTRVLEARCASLKRSLKRA